MTVSPLPLDDYAALCNCYTVRPPWRSLARPYKRISVDIFDGETLTEELLGELRRESHNTTLLPAAAASLPPGSGLRSSTGLRTVAQAVSQPGLLSCLVRCRNPRQRC